MLEGVTQQRSGRLVTGSIPVILWLGVRVCTRELSEALRPSLGLRLICHVSAWNLVWVVLIESRRTEYWLAEGVEETALQYFSCCVGRSAWVG